MSNTKNKTQHLIYRNYQKQTGRITNLRHHLTTKSFFNNQKPHSKNKHHRQVTDEFHINAEAKDNNNLENTPTNLLNNKVQQEVSTEEFKRYPPLKSNQTKTKIHQDQLAKFTFPSNQNIAITSKQSRRPSLFNKKYSLVEKSYKRFESHSVSRDAQEIKSGKQKEVLYNLPQRNQNRNVIFKKTLVLSSMQSCLLELSIIDQRLLITAYLMGIQNTTLRQIFPKSKSIQLLKDYQNNYETLCNRILIQKNNNKYQILRLLPLKQDNKEVDTEQDKNKQMIQIQKEFIKRNFYTVTRVEENIKSERSKPSMSYTQMKAFVQRLAGTKKYEPRQSKPEDILKKQHQFNLNPKNKEAKKKLPPKPQLIHISKRIQLQENKNEEQNNQIQEVHFSEFKPERIDSQQSNKGLMNGTNQHQQQKQININEQAQYQQQFENPSSYKPRQEKEELHPQQSQLQMKKQEHAQQKKQQQQEQYEGQFDNPSQINLPERLPVKDSQIPKQINQYEDSFVEQNDEVIYEQMYQTSKLSKTKQIIKKPQIQQYQLQFET